MDAHGVVILATSILKVVEATQLMLEVLDNCGMIGGNVTQFGDDGSMFWLVKNRDTVC